MNVLNTRLYLRRDTAENWSLINPILGSGEPGYDETNKVLKIGDNVTPWNTLLPISSGSAGDYIVKTSSAFTITPTSKVLYNGTTAATATIVAGTTAGQSVELVNTSDFSVTISATGTPLHNMTVAAGASVRYVWDGAAYDVISSGTTTTSQSLAQAATTPDQWAAPFASVVGLGAVSIPDAAGTAITYQAELVDLASATITTNTSWGDITIPDKSFVFVRRMGDLTINSGVTVTTSTRKLGLILYVDGNLVVNGKISMTARGANHGSSGSNITPRGLLVSRAAFGSNQVVEALGGAGVSSSSASSNTNPAAAAAKTGGSGVGGAGGGGGCGASSTWSTFGGDYGAEYVWSSVSTAGTCFTGGTGGGKDASAQIYGGAGGTYYNSTGGGAGTPPGGSATAGQGGMLYIFVKGNITISSGASLESKGSNGFAGTARSGTSSTGIAYSSPVYGGGSGGGAIYVGHQGAFSNAGVISVTGGTGGGNGGVGSSRVVNLSSIQ